MRDADADADADADTDVDADVLSREANARTLAGGHVLDHVTACTSLFVERNLRDGREEAPRVLLEVS